MWVKLRHKIIFAVLRPIFRIFLFFKYGYTCAKFRCGIKKPYVILSNHLTTLDPFMLSLSFGMPVYFMASDDLFSIRYASPLIRWLAAPIPKTKSSSDLRSVKDCSKVIKEGGTICVFPEGNRSYNGVTSHIPFSTVKFVKILKAPLLLYRIEGGYGVQPRWAGSIRRGKMFGSVQRVLTYEEYKDMEDDALYKFIVSGLYSNAFADCENMRCRYRSKRKAEYLERFLYVCPDCGDMESLKSSGNLITCQKCGYSARYNENLTLTLIRGKNGFMNVYEWDLYQKDAVRKLDIQNPEKQIFSDNRIIFKQNIRCKRKIIYGQGVLKLYGGKIEISVEGNAYTFSLKGVNSMAVFGKNRLSFYTGDEIYQCLGDKRFNALKYVNVFYHIKNGLEGVTDEFLGL